MRHPVSVPVSVPDVRALAMALPRTTEGFVQRRVKFYVGRIVYVAFSRDETQMGVAFPREFREAAVASAPEKFLMPTGGDLRYKWIEVRTDAVDVPEMRELVIDAWSMVVPQKVIDAYVASTSGAT